MEQLGATAGAIRSHYDVDNEFYALWLDPTMAYSCAMWAPGDELETAQLRKIDYYLDQLGVGAGSSLLDVGCGWGGVLQRATERGAARVEGLTLSAAQQSWVATHHPEATCHLRSWQDHLSPAPFDALVSIGAFEHFARRDLDDEQRAGAYRSFFAWAAGGLREGGRLAVQTIVIENAPRSTSTKVAALFDEVFPESSLPRLPEVLSAADAWFSVESVLNQPDHYERTCRAWLDRLASHRAIALDLVGDETVRRFERYLAVSEMMFRTQRFGLARIVLRLRGISTR